MSYSNPGIPPVGDVYMAVESGERLYYNSDPRDVQLAYPIPSLNPSSRGVSVKSTLLPYSDNQDIYPADQRSYVPPHVEVQHRAPYFAPFEYTIPTPDELPYYNQSSQHPDYRSPHPRYNRTERRKFSNRR